MNTEPGDERRCPWCSSPIEPEAAVCGRCGAALVETGAPLPPPPPGNEETEIPGVTRLDPVLEAYRARVAAPPPKKRRNLLSLLTGVDPDKPVELPASVGPIPADALRPPSAEVRREMLRIELEALGLSHQDQVAPPADPPDDGSGESTTRASSANEAEETAPTDPAEQATPTEPTEPTEPTVPAEPARE